jgi:quinoprotein glucose dehydrogenase
MPRGACRAATSARTAPSICDVAFGTARTFVEEYQLTSPPAVIRDLLITGSSVADNNRVNAASGEVRAFDARTGALRWTWDPVPRDSTDPAWASWGRVGRTTGAANVWSVIAVDSASDLAFVPTTAPSPDYFGGERPR